DITGAGTFGYYVSANMLNYLAQYAFANLPHTFNTDGVAIEGPIHLTGIAVLLPTNKDKFIQTQITGYDRETVPPMNFKVTLTDTLSLFTPTVDDPRKACARRVCNPLAKDASMEGPPAVDVEHDLPGFDATQMLGNLMILAFDTPQFPAQ